MDERSTVGLLQPESEGQEAEPQPLYDRKKYTLGMFMSLPELDLLRELPLTKDARLMLEIPDFRRRAVEIVRTERQSFFEAGKAYGNRMGELGMSLLRGTQYLEPPNERFAKTVVGGTEFYLPYSEFPELAALQRRRAEAPRRILDGVVQAVSESGSSK